jgi:hypothetical protein
MRLRNRGLVPGEDVYFSWYVLTKPFVGALGAMVLYVLIHGGALSTDLAATVIGKIKSGQPGPGVFGFAFLSGFSERLVFRGEKYEKAK